MCKLSRPSVPSPVSPMLQPQCLKLRKSYQVSGTCKMPKRNSKHPRLRILCVTSSTPAVSGCCSCHGSSKLDPGEARGSIELFVFNRIIQPSGILRFSNSAGHSIKAAMFSAVLLLSGVIIYFSAPGCAMGSTSTVWSIIASSCVAGSLLLSSVSAYTDALVQALKGRVDAHTLMALAGTGSFVLGLPIEGALLFFLFHLAHALESKFVSTAQGSLSSLMDALPERAKQVFRLPDGGIDWSSQKQVKVDSVEVGSLLAIKPGDIVPLDGVVVEGSALVGQENITGESVPILKKEGSNVVSGGLVYDGTLVFLTKTSSSNSLTARIAAMTKHAIEHKAQVESFLSKLMRRWSQTVIMVTVAVLLLLLIAGIPMHGKHGALYRSLAVLTAGAPCALAVTPLAFVCAMAVLSRHGILVKGSSVLDKLVKSKIVVLDKTGTLTEGKLAISQSIPVRKSGEGDLSALTVAAALSFQGSHPVCEAILAQYASKSKSSQQHVPKVSQFKLYPGAGMSGKVDGLLYHFGSLEHVKQMLTVEEFGVLEAAVRDHGSGQVCSILVGKRLWGGTESSALKAKVIHLFTLSDKPKEGSGTGVKQIRELCQGLRIFTGDNDTSALDMAVQVGVDKTEVISGLTPELKAQNISKLQDQGQPVLMVGDGLNDAPALAQADVSAAFADSTSSIVANAADIVILRDDADSRPASSIASDMGRVAFLMSLARSVRWNVMQNLSIALVSMMCAVLPSVFGFFPLWVTVTLHEGSTILVALNSCRLLMKRPRVET